MSVRCTHFSRSIRRIRNQIHVSLVTAVSTSVVRLVASTWERRVPGTIILEPRKRTRFPIGIGCANVERKRIRLIPLAIFRSVGGGAVVLCGARATVHVLRELVRASL